MHVILPFARAINTVLFNLCKIQPDFVVGTKKPAQRQKKMDSDEDIFDHLESFPVFADENEDGEDPPSLPKPNQEHEAWEQAKKHVSVHSQETVETQPQWSTQLPDAILEEEEEEEEEKDQEDEKNEPDTDPYFSENEYPEDYDQDAMSEDLFADYQQLDDEQNLSDIDHARRFHKATEDRMETDKEEPWIDTRPAPTLLEDLLEEPRKPRSEVYNISPKSFRPPDDVQQQKEAQFFRTDLGQYLLSHEKLRDQMQQVQGLMCVVLTNRTTVVVHIPDEKNEEDCLFAWSVARYMEAVRYFSRVILAAPKQKIAETFMKTLSGASVDPHLTNVLRDFALYFRTPQANKKIECHSPGSSPIRVLFDKSDDYPGGRIFDGGPLLVVTRDPDFVTDMLYGEKRRPRRPSALIGIIRPFSEQLQLTRQKLYDEALPFELAGVPHTVVPPDPVVAEAYEYEIDDYLFQRDQKAWCLQATIAYKNYVANQVEKIKDVSSAAMPDQNGQTVAYVREFLGPKYSKSPSRAHRKC